MAAASRGSTRVRSRGGPSPEEYAAFISQIELTEIWLQQARVTNHHGPQTPAQAEILFSPEAAWEDREGGFRAWHVWRVRLEVADAPLAEIEVTFGLNFASERPMTDPIFALFQDVNLPVNTWPYLREFVSTTMGRMNWQPFTLPALKRVTTAVDRPAKSRSTPPAAHRRQRRLDKS